MTTTVREYEQIARAMARAKPRTVSPHPKEYLRARDDQWRMQISYLCDALAESNPRFDREKFTDFIEKEVTTNLI